MGKWIALSGDGDVVRSRHTKSVIWDRLMETMATFQTRNDESLL
jgi:hypothetical protein